MSGVEHCNVAVRDTYPPQSMRWVVSTWARVRALNSISLYSIFLCKHRTETMGHRSRSSLLCINSCGLYACTWPRLHGAAPFGMTSFKPETGPWAVSQQRPCHTRPLATCMRFVYLSVSLLFQRDAFSPHRKVLHDWLRREEWCVRVYI